MPSFKLALVQMRIDPGRKNDNLRRACDRLSESAARGAQVALLPEAMPVGWTDSSSAALSDAVPDGESCMLLRETAARLGIFVCSGIVEQAGARVYNSAVLIDPSGAIILHHRKLNELEIAHDCYEQGDRLAVAHTPLGCFGVMICSDAFARGQIVSRTLGLMGADTILSPCAWAVPADHDNAREPYGQLWRDNYGPVARDFQLWIAGCSNVGPITSGPWAGRKCIGSSMLVGPDGGVALQAPYGQDGEALLIGEIELQSRPARGDRWSKFWEGHATQSLS